MFVNYVIDFFFLLDIIVSFNSAYYEREVDLIEDRKLIACHYLKTWFFIDVLSILPFDKIFTGSDYNKLARIARVGRFYKLVKLTKLVRIFKIMKEQDKLLNFITDHLKVNAGITRLIFFILIFILLCHISTCLWIVVATFN